MASTQSNYYDNRFTGAYQTLDAEDLRRLIIGGSISVLGKDIRPFNVVMSYLSDLGYQPGYSDTGDVVLSYCNHGRRMAKKISMAKLLYICRDNNLLRQKECDNSYERMCLEEDAEELELVLDLYHATATSLRGAQQIESVPAKPLVFVMPSFEADDTLRRVIPSKAAVCEPDIAMF